MRVDDFQVQAFIDDQPAREYGDHVSDQEPVGREMSRYIEAVEGASLSVLCTVDPAYHFAPAIDYLRFDLYVDGNPAMSVERPKPVDEGQRHIKVHLDAYVRWSSAASWTKSNLYFDRLPTHNDQLSIAEGDIQQQLLETYGVIQVKVWRMVGKIMKDAYIKPRTGKPVLRAQEKAVKQQGISLYTDAKNPIEQPAEQRWQGKHADHEPIATFTFKYRSRAALHELGIIERSPTPVPIEERDPDTLTQEELREAMKKLQARNKDHVSELKQEAQLPEIKQEEQEPDTRHLAGLKHAREADDEDDRCRGFEWPVKKARVTAMDLWGSPVLATKRARDESDGEACNAQSRARNKKARIEAQPTELRGGWDKHAAHFKSFARRQGNYGESGG